MKFIPSRDLRIRPGKVWKDLKVERELVVTSRGQPVAVMVSADGGNLEETLRSIRRARAMEALRAIHKRWDERGRHLTMEEIDEIIRQTRAEQRSPGK
jgi:PHD/YefM family antitoxin component YafN of YafNO toxin-antitoxin module